ncbi:MAG: hypothetical protein JW731_06315 [Bacteroidales bacterium]|nr:hypothetical protein [Bacteroidales bacterium]
MGRKNYFPYLTIAVIFLIMLVTASNIHWGKDYWKGILGADAKGYYAYLPAVFIYHDLNFDFFREIDQQKYYSENLYYEYRTTVDGKVINKYYCGTAAAELPFFLIAHTAAKLLGYDADGYSKIYMVWINIGAIVYMIIGLFFLIRTLNFYKIRAWPKVVTLITVVFGTNLFYYAVKEPGMSHVYSFAFISMFVYYAKAYLVLFPRSHIPILSALLGIIILIRPVNGLIILILPFLAGNFRILKQGLYFLFGIRNHVLIGILIFIAIISLQFIIYQISTGHFFIYTYKGEGFDFLNPYFIDILFSYKKGLFLYTPIYLISFAGLYFIWKFSRFEFYSWISFFGVITYVFSSWWMWYYGGSFSSRVYVEFLPVFMILLAVALNEIRNKFLKSSFITLIFMLIIICQVQTYQYRYYQIHWSEMNKEKYWDVFLRFDKLNK